jgi:hypothetical protein
MSPSAPARPQSHYDDVQAYDGIDTRILSIRKACSAVQGTFAGDAADSVGSERFSHPSTRVSFLPQ